MFEPRGVSQRMETEMANQGSFRQEVQNFSFIKKRNKK